MTIGGSLGRVEATARGAFYVLREALRQQDRRFEGLTVAVQGFGNVGSLLAKFLAEHGVTIVAISDSVGGLYNPKGIDVPAALVHKQETGMLEGLRGAEPISNEDLVLVDCDVLAPCALEQVVTSENADKVRASIVVEGANGPLTPAADEILEDRGIVNPPRCARERGRRRRLVLRVGPGLQEYFWKEDEVNAKLNDITTRAFAQTWEVAESRGLTMRSAAYGLAVQRVAGRRTPEASTRSSSPASDVDAGRPLRLRRLPSL